MPPLLADFIHARGCKPICEKSLTLPEYPYPLRFGLMRRLPAPGPYSRRRTGAASRHPQRCSNPRSSDTRRRDRRGVQVVRGGEGFAHHGHIRGRSGLRVPRRGGNGDACPAMSSANRTRGEIRLYTPPVLTLYIPMAGCGRPAKKGRHLEPGYRLCRAGGFTSARPTGS